MNFFVINGNILGAQIKDTNKVQILSSLHNALYTWQDGVISLAFRDHRVATKRDCELFRINPDPYIKNGFVIPD